MTREEPMISICICTFKRPEMLQALLGSITRDLILTVTAEIVVVDNDRNETARGIVESYSEAPLPIRYFVEPEQNISLARNRSVSEARGAWIAMIDDDELPEPEWLVNLHGCARALTADAVFGPVKPIYGPSCPQWLIDGGFFEKGHLSTGTRVTTGQARTSNVLLRSDLFTDRTEPFNPAFGLTGGEDSFLFEGLLLDGFRLYWCDDGIVSEHVPANRATCQWLLKRAFRGGQTYGRLVLSGFGRNRLSTSSRIMFLAGTAIRFCFAVAASILCLPLGRICWFRWFRTAFTQIGKASALTPFTYKEYAR